MHKKFRRHICEECGYGALTKNDFINHMATVHKMGDKTFKCEECPYTTCYGSDLTKHINAVHNKIKNNFCVECLQQAIKML